jgi:hypothetical protein
LRIEKETLREALANADVTQLQECLWSSRTRRRGFDPDAIPDPLSVENLEAKHGRGIVLMRSQMNDVLLDAEAPKSGCGADLDKRIKERSCTGANFAALDAHSARW